MSQEPVAAGPSLRGWRRWVYGLTPLLLLALLLLLFGWWGPLDRFQGLFPPVEQIDFERVILSPGQFELHVINAGASPSTIAQVMVDEAYWQFTIEPGQQLQRLARAVLRVPYPWVAGEPHEIRLVTSTGLTFDHEIAVAAESPRPDAAYFGTFALLGVYVGVIPVFLGLLWFPFLRGLGAAALGFFLSLTMGLLVFLLVDTLEEALEQAGSVPGPFQGVAILLMGLVGTVLLLLWVGGRKRAGAGDSAAYVAGLIALGIGLHNLGEGLAIGAAYATGEIALGTFLVLGFTLHNTTEGLGIVAPLARSRPALRTLILLGLLAGAPTVLGAYVGGFAYSPMIAVLFLAVGAGAIAQVVAELWKLLRRQLPGGLTQPAVALGLLAGLVIMYATGTLVAV
jgi:zinc transporter ZupT